MICPAGALSVASSSSGAWSNFSNQRPRKKYEVVAFHQPDGGDHANH